MNWSIIAAVLSSVVVAARTVDNQKAVIAVIGGGIGGSATAYFTRELLDDDVRIVIFEAEKVGGRAATIKLANFEFEAGASIIHSRNRYMAGFLKNLNLSKVSTSYSGNTITSIYNGKEEVFRLSGGKIWQLLSLVWRYGLSLLKIDSLVDGLLDRFDRIYEMQLEQQLAFRNLRYFMRAIDAYSISPLVEELYNQTAIDFVEKNGLNKQFFNELVQAVTLSNYGQSLQYMNAFVGFVSLIGGSADLFAVENGNYRIPAKLIEQSGADLQSARVAHIIRYETVSDTAETRVHYELYDAAGDLLLQNADYVVIAAPQYDESSKIRFSFRRCTSAKSCVDDDVSGQRAADLQQRLHIPLHRTVATFIHGLLNRTTFPFVEKDLATVQNVLLMRTDLAFSSIGRQKSVNGQRPPTAGQQYGVYKVFSHSTLNDTQLSDLFEHIENKAVREWYAYPEYSQTIQEHDERLLEVQVDTNLFYTSSIERLASALEMSAIAAKNVALLIYHSRRGTLDRVDLRPLNNRERAEL